jgi:UDP-N-acetylmuramoyl-L-alanyl-D-glutamate--2,6-diaminopimelate ligase
MKLSDILRDLELVSASADPETEIGGVCYDSRKVAPGDLFVAVKGFSSDGHRFIPTAMEKGAAAVLCEDLPAAGTPYVQIRDCRLGLALASRNFFGDPAGEMTLIGITGTSGKTTSSYLVKHMLETKLGAKVGLIGTNGHMIGEEFLPSEFTTPESYDLQKLFRRMADSGCTHVVMEVSSHSLALERVAGVHFDVALYTNLSQDHLDFHHTMEEYAAAKKKIFSMCSAACVNADDAWADYMCDDADCPILRFSVDREDAELRAEQVELSAGGVRFEASFAEEKAPASLAIPGLFSVHNALGVMAVGLVLGLRLEDCAAALRGAKSVKGRLESLPTDGDYSIIIDYSHKPDALENVLKTLRPVTRGRLIVLFGCGGDRDRLKRPIMGAIAADNADLCIVTSDNPRTEEPEAIIDEIMEGMRGTQTPVLRVCDRREAIRTAIDNARAGDVILLAGKGHEDYQIVGHEKRHMDEREIVAEYLEMRKH